MLFVCLFGMGTVFFGLICIIFLVYLMGAFFQKIGQKSAAAPAAAPAAAEEVPGVPAPGTAGQLKLHDVDPKTAAIIMAIVADKMGKPLNELRFISIKEVK